MSKVYVVTEGDTDSDLLKSILPADVVAKVEFVVAGGRSHANSLARSILVGKRKPVALLVDSDTLNREAIQEQQLILEESLRDVAADDSFKVVLAAPELESLLFESPEVAHAVTGRDLSHVELEFARSSPKAYLTSSRKQSASLNQRLGKLSSKTKRHLQETSLLAEISEFVRSHANGD
jgi:hypothetical protein